jgi:hypothetical protein
MNSRTRIALAGVLVAAVTCCGAAGAYAAEPQRDARRLEVAVYDLAGVDPATLATAERIASDVYRRAGIEIEWVEAHGYEDDTRLYVNLLSLDMVESPYTSKDTVGFATPGSLAANAIYDRIRIVARKQHLPCAVLLGYVIAHELGHLLLPANSHSASGLMMPNLNVELAAAKKLRFTNDQAALMLERLRVSPVVSTH